MALEDLFTFFTRANALFNILFKDSSSLKFSTTNCKVCAKQLRCFPENWNAIQAPLHHPTHPCYPDPYLYHFHPLHQHHPPHQHLGSYRTHGFLNLCFLHLCLLSFLSIVLLQEFLVLKRMAVLQVSLQIGRVLLCDSMATELCGCAW